MSIDVTAKVAEVVPPQMETSPKRQGNALFFIAKLVLSLLVIGAIYYTGSFTAAWRQISKFDPWFAFAAVLAALTQMALGGMRWRYILVRLGASVRARDALQLFYISAFFNTYVWGAVSGDVLRAWLLYRARITPSAAVHSVILDRVASVAAVALLVLATMPWLAMRTGYTAALVVLTVASAAILAAIALVSQLERLPVRWHSIRVVRLLQDLGGATQRVLLTPASPPVFATAILTQLALGFVTYLLSRALGIEVGLINCLVLIQPVALVVGIPISIGGWGVREAAMIGLFGIVHVPAPAALLLSMSLGLLGSLVSLPGGLMWFFWRSETSHAALQQ